MTGAIIQLVAYGFEDMFLTRNPQITYFKVVYRRHTNFSSEQIPIIFSNQQVNFGKKITTTIKKNGDLIGDIVVVITLPAVNKFLDHITNFAWVRRVGFAMIKTIEIEINGRVIDRHYGEWLSLWSELSGDIGGNYDKFNNMIGDVPELTNFTSSKNQYTLYIPLKFWFCRSTGLALPIAALQYSDVKINIEFNEADVCYKITPTHYIECESDIVNFLPYEYIQQTISTTDIRCGLFSHFDIITNRLYYYKISNNKFIGISTTGQDIKNPTVVTSILNQPNSQIYKIVGNTSNFSIFPSFNATSKMYVFSNIRNLNIVDCHLLGKYYFLDDDERLKFLQVKHDYIIEQLFYTPNFTLDSINENVRITVDQPCKLMVWITQQDYIAKSLDTFNYTNSHIRKYNNSEYPDESIGDIIGSNLILNETILLNGLERLSLRNSNYFNYQQPYQYLKHNILSGINMYSFCLYPLNVQPSGSCNMSQIDTIEIQMQLSSIVNVSNTANFRCYSLCQQIFRISNGIGSPVFIK
jgi:hypothetical protein